MDAKTDLSLMYDSLEWDEAFMKEGLPNMPSRATETSKEIAQLEQRLERLESDVQPSALQETRRASSRQGSTKLRSGSRVTLEGLFDSCDWDDPGSYDITEQNGAVPDVKQQDRASIRRSSGDVMAPNSTSGLAGAGTALPGNIQRPSTDTTVAAETPPQPEAPGFIAAQREARLSGSPPQEPLSAGVKSEGMLQKLIAHPRSSVRSRSGLGEVAAVPLSTIPQNGSMPRVTLPQNGSVPLATLSRNGSVPRVTLPQNGSVPLATLSRNGSVPHPQVPQRMSMQPNFMRPGSLMVAYPGNPGSIRVASPPPEPARPLVAPPAFRAGSPPPAAGPGSPPVPVPPAVTPAVPPAVTPAVPQVPPGSPMPPNIRAPHSEQPVTLGRENTETGSVAQEDAARRMPQGCASCASPAWTSSRAISAMASRSTVQHPTNPTPSSSQKLLPFQSQAPVVDRGAASCASPAWTSSRAVPAMVSRSTVQQPTNPTPSSSQKLLPFQSQAPVVDRGVMALAEPVAVESRTPVEPVAVEMAETPSLSVPSTNCTAAMAQVGKPIRDWTEEDVAVFLMQLSSVPMDIIDVVHTHAISGAVLLSLTDEDLESLNIEKFGHRRLLLLAAQELRRAVQAG
eukprot:symbB.v1.2.009188.t1/scaffold581.1/size274127/2